MSESSISQRLQPLLERLRNGDAAAGKELINVTYERFQLLARKVLRSGFTRLKRWEETDDVVQEAALRLWKALESVKPNSVKDFLNLGSVHIRRELLDLCRRYFGRKSAAGPPGMPAASPAHAAGELAEDLTGRDEAVGEAVEFHELVERLPEDEREVVGLLYYQGLTQEEAAEVLNVDRSTVKRRWRAARLKLGAALAE